MAPPTGAIPPALPPSVEEAYRRKCVQLKRRTNEVEESNDSARLRLSRLGREIEKLRLERAFLLENLAKRTSTNVEDSEGSPSPPATPEEKPLRTKRGHRKSEFLKDLGDGPSFIQHGGNNTLSPSSDAFTHADLNNPPRNSTPQASLKRKTPGESNGYTAYDTASPGNASLGSPPRHPKNAFDLYCQDTKSVLGVQHRAELVAGTTDIAQILAKGWQKMTTEEREPYQGRFDMMKVRGEADMEGGGAPTPNPGPATALKTEDQDVEMRDEAASPTAAAGEAGGFTSVNLH